MSSEAETGGVQTLQGKPLGEVATQFLDKTPLRFPRELEKLFLDDYREKSLPFVRISLVLGIALYAVFGVLDVFIAPQTKNITWLIRYAIVCPLMAVSLGLSWLPAFKKFAEIDTMIVGLSAGFGIIAIIALARDADAVRYYYAGLILVLIYVYTFTKMRFALATVTSWIIILGYEAVAIGALRMLDAHETVHRVPQQQLLLHRRQHHGHDRLLLHGALRAQGLPAAAPGHRQAGAAPDGEKPALRQEPPHEAGAGDGPQHPAGPHPPGHSEQEHLLPLPAHGGSGRGLLRFHQLPREERSGSS